MITHVSILDSVLWNASKHIDHLTINKNWNTLNKKNKESK